MLNILKCIEIINHDVVYQELTLCFRSITFQNRQSSKQTKMRGKEISFALTKGYVWWRGIGQKWAKGAHFQLLDK